MASLLSAAPSSGAETASCDKVSTDLKAAIEREPKKVLVFIEDAMVANESCACEIVKTAVQASKADGDLLKQIVLTATNVAPKMSAKIAECAGMAAPATAPGQIQGLDNSKSVKQVMAVAPPADTSTGPDFTGVPSDIRGVYLIQPSAAVVATQQQVPQKNVHVGHKTPHAPTALSPAQACPKDP